MCNIFKNWLSLYREASTEIREADPMCFVRPERNRAFWSAGLLPNDWLGSLPSTSNIIRISYWKNRPGQVNKKAIVCHYHNYTSYIYLTISQKSYWKIRMPPRHDPYLTSSHYYHASSLPVVGLMQLQWKNPKTNFLPKNFAGKITEGYRSKWRVLA